MKNKHIKSIITGIIVVTALIPIVITVFELITTDKESIVFLENYPAPIAIVLICYYLLLIGYGTFLFMKQLVSLLRFKNEKAKTELLHLKSQVNPHFFFNTLNNLYGLVAKDTQKAQHLILKLSDMMRYSIYEGEKEHVQLKDEVTYLKNYIDLHQMRYRKEVNIVFNSQIDEEYTLSPLMLIILLENAFKHGVENLRENAFIHIDITTFEKKLYFTIKNNFDDSSISSHTGIGISNLKRRLELVYPKKHTLTFSKKENVYEAKLILE